MWESKRIRTTLGGVIVASLAIVSMLFMSIAPAEALMPYEQTTEQGVVNYLVGDIDAFWSRNLQSWGYRYWTPYRSFYYTPQYTTCNINGSHYVQMKNSFYCASDANNWGNIWLDYGWNQSFIGSYGNGVYSDYSAGVIFAHEWAHHIQRLLGTPFYSTKGYELNADCLAGMYTRYGISTSGRLNGHDYYEGRDALAAIAGGDHGTASERTYWYSVGYTYYSVSTCNGVLRTTVAGRVQPRLSGPDLQKRLLSTRSGAEPSGSASAHEQAAP